MKSSIVFGFILGSVATSFALVLFLVYVVREVCWAA